MIYIKTALWWKSQYLSGILLLLLKSQYPLLVVKGQLFGWERKIRERLLHYVSQDNDRRLPLLKGRKDRVKA